MQSTYTGAIESGRLLVEGTELAYYSAGEGVPILCLHAVGHSAEDYRALLDVPPAGFRVIAVDFPGHGRSGPFASGREHSSENYAALIERWLEALALNRPILVGNSIGGATALRLAARPGVRARGLALANPGGLDNRKFPGDVVLAAMVRFFEAGVRERSWFPAAFGLYYRLVLSARRARSRRAAIVREGPRLASVLAAAWSSFRSPGEDLRGLIAEIQCPVLVTWAMRDRFVQYGRNLAALREFRQAQILRYRIGHTPSVENPEVFARDLEEFCRRCVD